ncbi:ABC transporter permease [Nocardia sp. NPDC048505]|uniref:ABC transporter permease n=1 Tax=unclassified Nocardia TaxID=2637762 RepID=UPI0033DA6D16
MSADQNRESPPDQRLSYLIFGFAWLLGYGAFALAEGADPLVPDSVAAVLLFGGLLAGLVVTAAAIVKGGVRGALTGNLLAGAWVIGFAALSVLIWALSTALDEPQVQTLLWPPGAGLVVGMLYLTGGIAYRDLPQYVLGVWLAMASAVALCFAGAGLYWVLAVAGGGGYLAAAVAGKATRRGGRAQLL